MLRPEAYSGLVHNTLVKNVITPLPESILRNTVSIWLPMACYFDGRSDRGYNQALAVTEVAWWRSE